MNVGLAADWGRAGSNAVFIACASVRECPPRQSGYRAGMALDVQPIEYGDHFTRHDYYQPVYRVDLWRQLEGPPGSDPALWGWKQDAYRIRGAMSVRQVRAWAESNAGGRQIVIWIELGPENDRTIARVEGIDPTNPNEDSLAE